MKRVMVGQLLKTLEWDSHEACTRSTEAINVEDVSASCLELAAKYARTPYLTAQSLKRRNSGLVRKDS